MGWGEATHEQSTCTESNWGRTKDAPPALPNLLFKLNSQCNEYHKVLGGGQGEAKNFSSKPIFWEFQQGFGSLGVSVCLAWVLGPVGYNRIGRSWGEGCSAHRHRTLKMTHCVTWGKSENFSVPPFPTNLSFQMWLTLVWLQSVYNPHFSHNSYAK